jgi:hypothetical protein
MNRAFLGAIGLAACFGAVACGGASAGGSAATATPSPSANGRLGFAGNAAFGELVQINGSTLILSSSTGDSTVTYGTTTTITQTATETVADITAGDCISVTGSKGADGAIIATSMTLSAPAKGSCSAAGQRGGGSDGAGGASPRPSFSPGGNFSPPAGASDITFARGQVKAISGTTLTITETSGTTGTTATSATVTVPTTVKVSVSTVVTSSALETGQCLTAIGAKDTSGTVAATALTISPAGANGCTAGFGGGFPGAGGLPGGGGFPGGGTTGG